MNVAIIGVGAMASLFAGRLAEYLDVYMVGSWQQQIEMLQRNPLALIDQEGVATKHEVFITNNTKDIPEVDWILILVKTYQTKRAVEQAKSIWTNRSQGIITLQNGLGNREVLCEYFATQNCVVGVTTQAAKMISPGIVENTGNGSVFFANDIAQKHHPFIDVLRRCGWQVDLVSNMQSLLWEKLTINAGINPLTALIHQKNGYLATNPMARDVMNALAKEVVAVAHAQQIPISFANNIESHMQDIAMKTAVNSSSMLCDILRNSPTEIDAICGAVERHGKLHDVPTPLNALVCELIQKPQYTPYTLQEIWKMYKSLL